MPIRCAIVLASLLLVAGSARGGSHEMARFEREYPAAAKRLEARFSRVKGNGRLWQQIPAESVPARTESASFARDHGREKVRIRRKVARDGPTDPEDELIYCMDEDTIFYLARPAGKERYIVQGIGSSPIDRSAYMSLFGKFVKAHDSIFGTPVVRLMSASGYRLLGAERSVKDGRESVSVEFEVGAKSPKDRVAIVFDPQSDWLIQSSEFHSGANPALRIRAEIQYSNSRDGSPVPRRITFDDGSTGSSMCEFIDWTFEPTAESEFTMPHYGLPDLVSKVSKHRSPLPYWLAGGAATCILFALVARRCSVRRARDAVPPVGGSGRMTP